MRLVVGLGNPGDEYKNTRHNIGFMFLDRFFCDKFNFNKKFNAMEYITTINNEKYVFIKPYTYMNSSGDSVIKYINYYKIDSKNVIVIQDDLDISLGKFKLIYKHGDGGHNGIKSIVNNIGNNEFLRIKFGISKLDDGNNRDYVLGKFNGSEIDVLNHEFDYFFNFFQDAVDMNMDLLIGKYNSIK